MHLGQRRTRNGQSTERMLGARQTYWIVRVSTVHRLVSQFLTWQCGEKARLMNWMSFIPGKHSGRSGTFARAAFQTETDDLCISTRLNSLVVRERCRISMGRKWPNIWLFPWVVKNQSKLKIYLKKYIHRHWQQTLEWAFLTLPLRSFLSLSL